MKTLIPTLSDLREISEDFLIKESPVLHRSLAQRLALDDVILIEDSALAYSSGLIPDEEEDARA
ncbi:hypothetical protein AB0M87_32780 [Streptomyces sp. NPDC051320]|uniref:hypothetical protein n=1 Tax=Streptomyces sp. NPDC051320 TaxID=3154644 RepID=UPI00343C2812